jgi:hypothetical protein
VESEIVTDCTDVYVPAVTEKVGVATVPVAVPVTVAVPLFPLVSVAVSVAVFIPVVVGEKVTVVANALPLVEVAEHAPVVAAENCAAAVPLAAKVTSGPALQPSSFRIVVTLVAVDGVPTADGVATRLLTSIR